MLHDAIAQAGPAGASEKERKLKPAPIDISNNGKSVAFVEPAWSESIGASSWPVSRTIGGELAFLSSDPKGNLQQNEGLEPPGDKNWGHLIG